MDLDNLSERRLTLVHPRLADKIRTMASLLWKEGVSFRVTQGLRTWQDQDRLYCQGRTTPGSIVTNAPAGHSYHQFGLAVDVVPMLPADQGKVDWDVRHPVWQKLVSVGLSLGLTPGATFRSFPDWPHFQLTGRLPESPNDEIRQLFKDGGTIAVWEEAFRP